MELLFERFLSDDRREAPDIDIDFAHRDREEVSSTSSATGATTRRWSGAHHLAAGRRSRRTRVLSFGRAGQVLSTLADRFSAEAPPTCCRDEPEEMTGRHYDLDRNRSAGGA
jgi:error-prone DNA polymerase